MDSDGLMGSSDAFANATTVNTTTADVVHSFLCQACTVGPLTQLTVSLPSTCQAIVGVAAAVGTSGNFTAASFEASEPQQLAAADAPVLSEVAVVLLPMLGIVNDLMSRSQRRGYMLSVQTPTTTLAVAPATVTVTVSMALSGTYSLTTVTQLATPLQLASNIASWTVLLGVSASAYYAIEFIIETVRQKRREAGRGGRLNVDAEQASLRGAVALGGGESGAYQAMDGGGVAASLRTALDRRGGGLGGSAGSRGPGASGGGGGGRPRGGGYLPSATVSSARFAALAMPALGASPSQRMPSLNLGGDGGDTSLPIAPLLQPTSAADSGADAAAVGDGGGGSR